MRVIFVLVLCVLSCSRASPIASGGKEDAVVPAHDAPAPAPVQEIEEKDVAAKPEAPKEEIPEPAKDSTEAESKPAADAKPEAAEPKPEEPISAEEPKREARNLGTGNQANEVGPNGHQLLVEPEEGLIQKLNSKCSQRDVSSCVMLKMMTYMNRLLKKSNIEVFDGLHITQTTSEVEVEQETQPLDHPRSADEEDDETQIGLMMANKLWTFVRTRSLRWNIFPDADIVMSSPDGEGTINLGMSIRTAKALEKGRARVKNLGPLVAAAAMKFGLLGVLALKGLALLVGKALLVSKIALLLAGILWLKKLFSHQKHVTYEVVAHPHHTHSSEHHGGGGDSYSSGWGRSSDTETASQQLAYRGYARASAPQ